MKYAELAKEQAKVLIDLMAEGKPFLPFMKPGDPSTVNNLPYNAATGKPYNGGNRVMLWIAGMVNNYSDNRWLTYKQAQAVGGQVRNGAKSIQLRYTKFPDAKDPQIVQNPLEDRVKTFYFNVFNADHIDGLPSPPLREETTPAQRIERCEALLSATGAVIEYGSNQPYYAMTADKICMPHPERFLSMDLFYAVALHELSHWTGHESRLARDMSGKFGSEQYAREEMVAETASHIMGVELGIGHDPSQHAAYIKHWMKIAQADPNFLYTAASAAEKICDFVGLERFSFEPMVEPEPDVDTALPEGMPNLESIVSLPRVVSQEMAMAM